jgi:uncharacterized protein
MCGHQFRRSANNHLLAFAIITCAASSAFLITSKAQTLVPRGSEQPSFNCLKAKTAAARLICADGELARLDRELHMAFQKRKAQLSPADAAAFVAGELTWIRDRNSRCDLVGKNDAAIEMLANSKPCVVSSIQERIAFLMEREAASTPVPPSQQQPMALIPPPNIQPTAKPVVPIDQQRALSSEKSGANETDEEWQDRMMQQYGTKPQPQQVNPDDETDEEWRRRMMIHYGTKPQPQQGQPQPQRGQQVDPDDETDEEWQDRMMQQYGTKPQPQRGQPQPQRSRPQPGTQDPLGESIKGYVPPTLQQPSGFGSYVSKLSPGEEARNELGGKLYMQDEALMANFKGIMQPLQEYVQAYVGMRAANGTDAANLHNARLLMGGIKAHRAQYEAFRRTGQDPSFYSHFGAWYNPQLDIGAFAFNDMIPEEQKKYLKGIKGRAARDAFIRSKDISDQMDR